MDSRVNRTNAFRESHAGDEMAVISEKEFSCVRSFVLSSLPLRSVPQAG